MAKYKQLIINSDNGGYGGPLKIIPTKEKDKLLYMTRTGELPEIIKKITEISGLTAINGFEEKVREDELALVVIDCGGSLRAGIYPKKEIPTVNIRPTGRSGPLWKYMTEDLYASGVNLENITVIES